MKTKLFFLFALLGMMLSFTACSDDDGAWDEMKWAGYSSKNDITVNISKDGGSETLHCTNYEIWLSSVSDVPDTSNPNSGSFYLIEETDKDGYHVCTATTDFGTVQTYISQLQVTMQPNNTGKERKIIVSVTAGDIFDTITFVQAAE